MPTTNHLTATNPRVIAGELYICVQDTPAFRIGTIGVGTRTGRIFVTDRFGADTVRAFDPAVWKVVS